MNALFFYNFSKYELIIFLLTIVDKNLSQSKYSSSTIFEAMFSSFFIPLNHILILKHIQISQHIKSFYENLKQSIRKYLRQGNGWKRSQAKIYKLLFWELLDFSLCIYKGKKNPLCILSPRIVFADGKRNCFLHLKSGDHIHKALNFC